MTKQKPKLKTTLAAGFVPRQQEPQIPILQVFQGVTEVQARVRNPIDEDKSQMFPQKAFLQIRKIKIKFFLSALSLTQNSKQFITKESEGQ